jgi:hypothetical protein
MAVRLPQKLIERIDEWMKLVMLDHARIRFAS